MSSRDGLLLGVDGGNTKTVALLADARGTLLARAVGGCTDIYGAASLNAALSELERVVRECSRSAGARGDRIRHGVFCLAGADWPEDLELITKFVHSRRLASRARVYNDAFGALRAGTEDFVGVSIVCGTGGATGARAEDGTMWHSSWWQDPQGARQLGRLALRAVYHSHLGIEPRTSMTEPMLRAYSAGQVEGLLHAATARGHPPFSTEPAARVLTGAAEAGDELATRLLHSHGIQLAAIALVAARQVGLSPGRFPIVMSGSVLHASSVLRRAVVEGLVAAVPASLVRLATRSPATGALLLACEAEEIELGDEPATWEGVAETLA
jgi:N-acetylglucosamine kinase-like BadF-type ATPase